MPAEGVKNLTPKDHLMSLEVRSTCYYFKICCSSVKMKYVVRVEWQW